MAPTNNEKLENKNLSYASFNVAHPADVFFYETLRSRLINLLTSFGLVPKVKGYRSKGTTNINCY